MMAAYDIFEITVDGRGSHGAMPHQSIDPVVIGAQIVLALQTIVQPQRQTGRCGGRFGDADQWRRYLERDSGTGSCSVGPRAASGRECAINSSAGSARSRPASRGRWAAPPDLRYERRYPPLVNQPEAVARVAAVACEVVGDPAQVDTDIEPVMGAEDFAFMLESKPGAYIMIGNGGGDGGRMLHNARYDFNDAILPIGASYWARLVETSLSGAAAR